jgi:hypothetical protein
MHSQYTQQQRLLPLSGPRFLEDMNVMVRLSSPYDAVLVVESLAALCMSRLKRASKLSPRP